MSDDKDEDDASDWLSGQFAPTEHAATPPSPPALPPPAAPPLASPPVTLAPSAPAGGGFSWGLRPGGSADSASAPTVPGAPAAPFVPSAPPPPVAVVPSPVAPPPVQIAPTLPFAPVAQTPIRPPAEPSAVDYGQPTEAYTVQPWQPATPSSPAATSPIAGEYDDDAPSAIDSLFGDHQFQDYEEVGVLKAVQASPVASSEIVEREPRAPLASSQKALMGVAGGLIAVLLLIAMFFLGEHLGTASAATPTVKPTSGSTSGSTKVPTPAGTGGPAAPGVEQWTALQGGECIQPFSSAWAITFTVIACASDHDAQMVFKGKLSDSADTKYPTTSQFQTELTPLCSAATAINYAAAASVTDLQVSFSYPPNSTSWIAGDRTYYCFIDRVSGGNLPGDLSVPKPAS